MELALQRELGNQYQNPAQKARVITEAWVRENLFCLGCEENRLSGTRPDRSVVDFRCPNCARRYQLKSRRRPFGNRIVDAAWEPMATAVRAGRAPSFLFLHYDSGDWVVENFFGIPSHFMTLSAIEMREPLPPTARRAGWIGCNILLNHLPPDAKVFVVRNRERLSPDKVRQEWSRYEFLKGASHESRGWTADVLACVRRLNQTMFTLQDVYGFEEELARHHPHNRHVRAKTRQQLQVLRDQGVLKFLGEGNYLFIDSFRQ